MIRPESFSLLEARIANQTAKVGILGLGYVGLPLASAFLNVGFEVLGFDVDQVKVNRLNSGQSYIRGVPDSQIAGWIGSGRFAATNDPQRLAEPDALLICVPTPLGRDRSPDLTYVEQTARQISGALRVGQLVVLESTTYPTTTRNIVLPLLEASGLREGSDFYLAYSPEREDPGNPQHTASKIPKVVGGIDPLSCELAARLYRFAVVEVVPVSSAEVAEACKILENTYRAVNIALVNELKILFDRMNLDIWEVIAAAKTKPFGFQAFYPGPGLGGHCIPIDPYYLSWLARTYGLTTRFIELAGEVNSQMPAYVVGRVTDFLNDVGRSVRGSKILILGMAYKKDVDDPRESPAFELFEELLHRGGVMSYHDPYIPVLPRMRTFQIEGRQSIPVTAKTLGEQDLVLIATDHSCIDYADVVKHARLIVDTRNATRDVTDGREKIRFA